MSDLVRRLRRLDVCAVSDAMDKLGLSGHVGGLAQYAGTERVAGTVVTYRLLATSDVPAQSGPPVHLGTRAIEFAKPGEIIVVEQRTGIDAGSWGGILSLAAKTKGIAGVISEGLVRDIDEARNYDFPVFARGLTARTARGRVAEIAVNETIGVGEATVRTGDYVIADAGGVVFIAAEDIERVLKAAEYIAGREAAMAKAILAGTAVSQVMGADYEHMLN
ncbi:RraA family protein [Paraburkholderia sp. J12]|uniref:RraA family protein n=1 Tax=Paraburkholderia sp. J12 TaxID=2805432 RepID=UPI002ABD4F99|nr:RraA family protein [Paraburkholderia sp. J12]